MTGTFLDVNAPNTNWRGNTEDPIPLFMGRWVISGGIYRFVSGREMDGHARTDAGFLRKGTQATTFSHHTRFFDYWPHWKRGLLLTRAPTVYLPAWTVAAYMNDAHWYMNEAFPVAAWLGLGGWWGTQGVRYARDYSHNRHVVRPIEAAAMNIIRSRSVKAEIPRSFVSSERSDETGRLWLPLEWSGAEGDRENLQEMLSERLSSPISCSFDMSGRTPSAILRIPKQPPKKLAWPDMLERANAECPYLGQSAAGQVTWDLGEDSPHLGIVGGSGSGKSELMAWIVAQFMRAGAGVVVLDPKNTSHRWLLELSNDGRGPLYCNERAMLHDTIIWLDRVLEYRMRRNTDKGVTEDLEFERLVVLLEERNSLQDMLRDYWAEIKPPGAPMKSPALGALDRLSSLGRSLNLTLILAAQATAQTDIGKRNNYGSFAIAGRMAANHYKNVGVNPKPAISAKPGRFAYTLAGEATVFQAGYPDLKRHKQRLIDWATGGEPLLDVRMMMTEDDVSFPRSDPSLSSSSEPTLAFVSLSEYLALNPDCGLKRSDMDNAKRNGKLPLPVDKVGKSQRYRITELDQFRDKWLESR